MEPPGGAAHIRLDHLGTLAADSRHELEDVHLLLRVHHVHHGVDDDEGARPAHARASGTKEDAKTCGESHSPEAKDRGPRQPLANTSPLTATFFFLEIKNKLVARPPEGAPISVQ